VKNCQTLNYSFQSGDRTEVIFTLFGHNDLLEEAKTVEQDSHILKKW
jgi:hypothetical protein